MNSFFLTYFQGREGEGETTSEGLSQSDHGGGFEVEPRGSTSLSEIDNY